MQKRFLKKEVIQWLCIVIGVLLLLAALLITVFFYMEEHQAEKCSEQLLKQTRIQMNEPDKPNEYGTSNQTNMPNQPHPNETMPVTGVNWLLVIVLAAGGAILLTFGLFLKKK